MKSDVRYRDLNNDNVRPSKVIADLHPGSRTLGDDYWYNDDDTLSAST